MSVSRRNLFRAMVDEAMRTIALAAPPPPKAPAPRRAFTRPPGALPEPEFLAACTRCDACLIACPHMAIRRAGHELGAANEGTPVILPDDQPCWLCEGMPCIDVCEPRALLPTAVADVRIGSVRMRENKCFSELGSPCDECVVRCPVQPRPISVGRGEAPVIDAETCTGCGVCAWLCPADAIEWLGEPV